MAQPVFTTSNALADIVANGVALQDLSSNIFSKMDALAPYRFRAGGLRLCQIPSLGMAAKPNH